MFFCIHLPGLVRQRPHGPCRRPACARRGGGQVGARTSAAARAPRGRPSSGIAWSSCSRINAGPPGGVLAAQSRAAWTATGGSAGAAGAAIAGRSPRGAARRNLARSRRTVEARQAERRGDLRRLAALLPEPERGLTDRNGDGAWHGAASRVVHHDGDHPLLYRCQGTIKLGVAIWRSILMSRDRGPPRGTLCLRSALPRPPGDRGREVVPCVILNTARSPARARRGSRGS